MFFYRNLLSISSDGVAKVMDILLDCLADENVEVREMASKVFSGVVRCSQRQSILPLKVGLFLYWSAIGLNWLYELESVRHACSKDIPPCKTWCKLRGSLASSPLCDLGHMCSNWELAVFSWAMDAFIDWRCLYDSVLLLRFNSLVYWFSSGASCHRPSPNFYHHSQVCIWVQKGQLS